MPYYQSFARPEHTDGYEGYNHLMEINGDVEYVKMEYILRNHDLAKLNKQKQQFIDKR